MTAKAQGFAMGLSGKKPMHKVGTLWFPGRTPEDLENWCKINCPSSPEKLWEKANKAVQYGKQGIKVDASKSTDLWTFEEKITEPETKKAKTISRNKNSANKDKKKD